MQAGARDDAGALAAGAADRERFDGGSGRGFARTGSGMLRADSHDAHATSFKSASSRGSATALCFPAEIAFIGRGGKGIPKPDAPLTSPAAQG